MAWYVWLFEKLVTHENMHDFIEANSSACRMAWHGITKTEISSSSLELVNLLLGGLETLKNVGMRIGLSATAWIWKRRYKIIQT